jgi:hypothetical protein
MHKQNQKLFKFAFFPNYDDCISNLAINLAEEEVWNYKGNTKYPILKNYLEHTYRKLEQEKKIAFTSDNKSACFNTGLITENLEDIYAFFEIYRSPKPGGSPFFFKDFLKKSDSKLLRLFSGNLPEPAFYFERPELLLFNPKIDLIPDIDHIISDNIERFPEQLREADSHEVRRQLTGAIDDVKKRVRTNYKIAVPQYYNGQIQLLLPLKLTPYAVNPDLALVVTKLNETTYSARTCLTLRMAYGNARLIVKPQSNWLKP